MAKSMEESFIVRNIMRYYEIGKYQREFLQSTNVVVKAWNGWIIISVVYSLLNK